MIINMPGIYKWMPLSHYHGGPGVSNSILSLVGLSPAHAKYAIEHHSEPTDPQRLGECFHTLTLEAEFYRDRFYEFDGDLRSNAKKEEWKKAEDKGLIVIREKQLETIKGMVEAVHAHDDAGALLDRMDAKYEESIYWQDTKTKLLCKVRPDIRISRPWFRILADLKSCKRGANKDAWSWGRQIADYRYHVQAAMYLEGTTIATGIPYDAFAWLTVESEAPYGVNVFMASKEMLKEGHAVFRRDLNIWGDCVTQGIFPNYEEGVKEVRLPKYARSGLIEYKEDYNE